MESAALQPTRFIGLDLHKATVVLCAVDRDQKVVLPCQRLDLGEFEIWMSQHLHPTDAVVLEATANAFHWYDRLRTHTLLVTVANPHLVKLIAAAKVKTDTRDALHLARLLAAGMLPPVWVPPPEVRELRQLVAQRRRLVQQRTQAQNRLHNVLHSHNLTPPEGELFHDQQRGWWQQLDLPQADKLRIRQDLSCLDHFAPLIQEVETELAHLSGSETWLSQATFLIQLPGVGVLTAMTLLASIGDITRFPSAKKLVGYSGLGASIHASGETSHSGAITKQGRRELRTIMVEAAWTAVEHDAHWKRTFQHLEKRLGRPKAIVAIARKLLVAVWHVLSHRASDRQADPERVAWKLARWARQIGPDGRHEQSIGAFVRTRLDRLRLGPSLQTLTRGKQKLRLPAVP